LLDWRQLLRQNPTRRSRCTADRISQESVAPLLARYGALTHSTDRRQLKSPPNMRRTLSSRTTILFSFVLPILIVAGLSCVLLFCWLGKITSDDGKPLPLITLCVFTLMWALVAVGLLRSLGFIKRVEVDDDALYVSNYRTEVRIPLSEVTAVRESGGSKEFTGVRIGLRHASAFGKTIEFLPRLWLPWSGTDPALRELKALCKQAGAKTGVDQATPFDPAEKIFEAGDDSAIQVGKDYILYTVEGKDEACEKDKFFFKDLARITIIRGKKSGRITAIDYKVKRRAATFEIGGYEPLEMEEIARLLESRAQSFPIQFLAKQSGESRFVPLLILGLGALLGTICSGWLLHFAWTVWQELGGGGALVLFGAICLPVLALTAAAWVGLWRYLRN
jgi:hypothetical protein